MFSVFHFPIVDVRNFLTFPCYRLNRPSWPMPVIREEFIRQFGPIRERLQGGIEAFAGEESYCDAGNAIRMVNKNNLVIENIDRHDNVTHKQILRRFYFDGRCVSKLELGFSDRGSRCSYRRQAKDWLHLIHRFADSAYYLSPRIEHEKQTTKLLNCGDELANLYLRSTTNKSAPARSIKRWWVKAAEPVLLFETNLEECSELPRYSKRVDTRNDAINLTYQRVDISGKKLNVWFSAVNSYNAPQRQRKALRQLSRCMRLTLLRFHAEVQALRYVSQLLSRGELELKRGNPGSEALQLYLKEATKFLKRKSRYGISQTEIMDAVFASQDLVSAGQRTTLL